MALWRKADDTGVMTSTLTDLGTIWLLGCGNMGGALLQRWMAGGLTRVAVIDPKPRALPDGIAAGAGPPDGASPDILVVAVKPQLLAAAAAPVVGRLKPDTLVISIMAGVSAAAVSAAFGRRAVVRTMPNTPAQIGQGVTALFGSDVRAEALMTAAGACVWLDDEAQFDAVTAVSGSGPAYVFAFVEALARAGVAAGLPDGLAAELALQTVAGAGALAGLRDATPAALRVAVTSPAGTTAAGLAVLQPALDRLLTETVAAAARRSRELGQPV